MSCYVVEHDAGAMLRNGARYRVSCYVVENDTGCLLRSGARYRCLVT